ncbi:MJ1477/TM1410 family putative glycoside hydrolase [Marinitoga litoralis]|uniref:MJ1477/TM1410 family putative glycoside hydrolase n=1 Tax=Marinitoga litoralis TaxID=570855 RepID=UPI001EF774E7|nr:MJ1477/TM1410 family putative glycoside hydrolase [Marinitoga litoralis]MBM7558476.1 cysteinyl-tRNA synthetase [Marinitoga litoralis]
MSKELISITTIFLLLISFLFIPKKEIIEVPIIYQINGPNIDNIISNYRPKFVILDYSKDGTDEKKFTHDDINKLKILDIIPLAYLSIGEAEDYRYYWKDEWDENPPSWIDGENPNWPGNYKVKYWYDDWKNIIFDYLDKIIAQGFMGVYLDLIDSYKFWAKNGYDIEATASEMIKLVIEIAEYARKKNPIFLVVPQNGEDIIKYDYDNKYIHTISGIGVESLFYKKTKKNSDEYINSRLEYILKIKNNGKFVLVTDYVYNPKNPNEDIIKDFINLCNIYGFYGYPANVNQKLKDLSDALKYFKEVKE